ncbi:MAG: 16S rRNA (guanine(527)-N(7))-methyltransferase RsmG [Chromatiaceae bacterium]|jgi:16S rRNA (guanine527-N7)-methyltransferase
MTQSGEQAADWQRQLASGLDAMRIALDRAQQSALVGYLQRLTKWNRRYNLTAVRDPKALVARHVLDSLSILPWVDSGPVLDVGTGAGLPGIPLAIARPTMDFCLIDSSGKKTRFLRQIVSELGQPNVEIIHGRVEQLDRRQHFALITSRAFAALPDMLKASAPMLTESGRFLAMKGTLPSDEIARLPPGWCAESVPLQVPGETARRHLVIVRRDDGLERGPGVSGN